MRPSSLRSTSRSLLVVVVSTLLMILVACGGGSKGGGSYIPPAQPTATLTANPTTITQGQQSTLTWSCTNASSCVGTGFDTGGQMSGTVSVSPSQTTTYGLTATGLGGSAQASATVTVTAAPPTGSVTANPTNIVLGQSVTLTMASTNATSCTGSGAWSGSVPCNGPQQITPTATGIFTYTVTFQGPGGLVSASATVTVNAFNLVYPQETIIATVGTAIIPDIPTVTGPVSSYAVSPALPAGLSLDSSTGVISGTPSVAAAQAAYTVTASGSIGNSTATVTITAVALSNVLLELGHAFQIQALRLEQSRLLSEDQSGHWVLWDYNSGAILASGEAGTSPTNEGILANGVDMAGQIAVIGIPNGLEVRAISDGHLISIIVFPGVAQQPVPEGGSWWQLASDGSYICGGSPAGIFVWAATGQATVSKPGDYSAAITFAAPGEVSVALGPAGQNVVETISTVDGTSTVSQPFSGTFNSWFLDGGRFLTTLSNTVWTYSNTGVQQAVVQLPTTAGLTGQGKWLWTNNGTLDIYPIGSDTPAFSCCGGTAIPSGLTIGILGGTAISVIDLSGPSPSKVDYTSPLLYGGAYAAASSSQWILGSANGRLLDGASLTKNEPRYFGLGQVNSIAGSTGRVAISTAAEEIFYFDPGDTTPKATISFPAGKVSLSSDGSVMGASANSSLYPEGDDRTLKIFSVPSGSLINSFPYTYQMGPYLLDFTLSGSGATLGQVLSNLRQVTATTGGAIIWSDNFPPDPILLSPDATLIAVSIGNGVGSSTNIYKNGQLVTAVIGFAIGWIDNDRLLANRYGCTKSCFYMNATIYSSTGMNLATLDLPELSSFQTVTSDSVYSPDFNTIFSLTTGQATWTSPLQVNPLPGSWLFPPPQLGAVAGSYVVFESGSQVVVQTY